MQFDGRGRGQPSFLDSDGERQRFEDRVVRIKRVSKVVRGGRRFGFNAIVVVGDRNGRVGVSVGRAREVADAIQKGQERARRAMFEVPLTEDGSIPHYVEARFRASKVILRPAGSGTGVIAGGAVRAVLELAGVRKRADQDHRLVKRDQCRSGNRGGPPGAERSQRPARTAPGPD